MAGTTLPSRSCLAAIRRTARQFCIACAVALYCTNAFAAPTDFNGDHTSDILARGAQGQVSIWTIQADHSLGDVNVATIPLGWTYAGVGDFDGDGKSDILWRGPNGEVGIWLMSGTAIKTEKVVATIPLSWTILGVGDFNGDGKADILWSGPGGTLAFWEMNGTSVAAAPILSYKIPAYWAFAGIGDFTGNGTSDILWLGENGEVAVWMIQNAQVTAGAIVASVEDSSRLIGIGKFNGRGTPDALFWSDQIDGEWIWSMNGTSPPVRTQLNGSAFQEVPLLAVGEYDGTGTAGVLANPSTGLEVIPIQNGVAQTPVSVGSVTLPPNWTIYQPRQLLSSVLPGTGTAAWKFNYQSVPTQFTDIQFLADGKTGFAVGDTFVPQPVGAGPPTFLKTTNGGASWTALTNTGKQNSFISAVQFLDQNNGWIAGSGESKTIETSPSVVIQLNYGSVMNTINGGGSWTNNSVDLTEAFSGVKFVDLLHGWLVGNSSTIYATVDGGLTWQPEQSPINNLASIRAADPLHAWATPTTNNISANAIVRTDNGGVTWSQVVVGPANPAYSSTVSALEFADVNHVWVVTSGSSNTDANLYRSSDGGKTWLQVSSPSAVLQTVSFSDSVHGFALDVQGGIYQTADGGTSWATLVAPTQTLSQMRRLVPGGPNIFWGLDSPGPSNQAPGYYVSIVEMLAL